MKSIQEWALENKNLLVRNEYVISDKCLDIKFTGINVEMQLSAINLESIDLFEIPKISQFQFFQYYGYKYKIYSEIFIKFDKLPVNTIDVKFKIGTKLFRLSKYSEMTYFLFTKYFESNSEIFHDSEFYNDNNYSLKLFDTNDDSMFDDIEKALFYINLYYVKNTATIENLPMEYDLNAEVEDVIRYRVRTRKDFKDIVPIKLYNYAINQRNDTRFLSFYRILEFYFPIITDIKIGELRYKTDLTNKEFLQSIKKYKSEVDSLNLLLAYVLSDNDQKRLMQILLKNKIINEKSKEKLYNALYSFRCSIVHAKSTMEETIIIPDPLGIDNKIDIWSSITKQISEKCIAKLSML